MKNQVITLRDSTLREGLETPKIQLDENDKIKVFEHLLSLGISNFEIMGPYASQDGLSFLKHFDHIKKITKSAIIPLDCHDNDHHFTQLLSFGINDIDVLFHISKCRLSQKPNNNNEFNKTIIDCFHHRINKIKKVGYTSFGIGLGDAFRADLTFLYEMVRQLTMLQPRRFILYDTVGFALPTKVTSLIQNLLGITSVPIYCHFHNDMGMATANTIIAIEKGAEGCDVTIGGLGDRSGNASLEEVALIAEHRLGHKTGIKLARLTEISKTIRNIFNLPDERRLPIVGDFAFLHSTPSHFNTILSGQYDAYEPYPPSLVGQTRCFQISDTQEFTLASKEWCRQRDIHNSHIELLAKRHRGQIVTEKELMELLNGD